MSVLSRFKRLWSMSAADAAEPAQEAAPDLRTARALPQHLVDYHNVAYWPREAKIRAYQLPKPLPGVLPKGVKIAQDSAVQEMYNFMASSGYGGAYAFSEGIGFLGYSYLAELTQRPEYRRPCEMIAKEMTRKWLRIVSTGDDESRDWLARLKDIKQRYRDIDASDPEMAGTITALREEWNKVFSEQPEIAEDKQGRINALEAEFKRLGIRKLFREAAEQDGWYGRSQLWLEVCDPDNRAELKTPLVADPRKIGKGGLKGLRLVEAMWTYPGNYDAVNPLRRDYFKPTTWYVNGIEVHSTRLLTFVSRPLPDILKPAYQFGGLSLSQMLKPYVDNWLRTRQSVSNAISNFSITVLATDMAQMLQTGMGDPISLTNRARGLNAHRDNNGVLLIQKEAEELTNVSMPLSSLDKLQAQSQEHMCAVSGLPLVVAFGITPSGLNASSDGEIKVWNDFCGAMQEATFSPNMDYLMPIIQISLFGGVDETISYVWEPLWSLNELEMANARKIQADVDCEFIDRGVLTNGEVRQRIAEEEDSPYAGIDLSLDLPNPQEQNDDIDAMAKLLTAQSREEKVEGQEEGMIGGASEGE